MRKKMLLASMALSYALCLSAQLPDGFYHIKNTQTGRYLSLNDTDPKNYVLNKNSGTVNLAGLRTYLSHDTVCVSPSCVFYVRKISDGKYDLMGQGSSIYEMTDYRLPVNLTEHSKNVYTISCTYGAFTKELMDRLANDNDGYIVSTDTGMKYWSFLPIDTSDEFVGIRPDVRTADGAYWGTIYAGFAFRTASAGMSVYYVDGVGKDGFTLTELEGGVVPAGTPVVVRCASPDPAANKIEPVVSSEAPIVSNQLDGVYCSLSGVPKHTNTKLYISQTMRIVGLDDKGGLAFVTASQERLYKELYLMANKAYLKVNAGSAAVMILGGGTGMGQVSASERQDGAVYTLTGIRISGDAPQQPGIYIKNGRKWVIR